MFKVFIDTSKRDEKTVSLFKNNEIISKKQGVDTTTLIQEILEENNLTFDDICEFGANVGPGSFTGLRMGLTTANILNWALGKKDLKDALVPKYGGEPNITLPKKFKV